MSNSNLLIILGSAVRNLVTSLKFIFLAKVDIEQLRQQMVFIGYESLPMIIILTSIASMILALNTVTELSHHGGRELVGALVSISLLREILPIFVVFAIAARCGTAMTAEISTMKVTEQVDVLKVLRIDPVYFLLVPRLLATFLLIPFIIGIALFVSMFTGMLVSKLTIDLEFVQFLESTWKAISLKEYFYPLLKAEVFALYAVLINVSMGLNCEGGAKEVGVSTTRATAIVMVGVIILDGLLTPALYV